MPVPLISRRFGAAVRKRRLAAGLSEELLAERAGVHPTYIGMVERGLRNPTLDVASRLAGALGIELPALISEALAGAGEKGRRG
jgi:transcriptional regulator with XRE-family HTH domain